MVTLEELRQITNDKHKKFELERQKATKAEQDNYEMMYQNIIRDLSSKLKKAAADGNTQFLVHYFSAFGFGLNQTLSDEIKQKMRGSGNYFCAWRDKKITEKDVIEHMVGNFKRVYEYLKENELEPKIQYWTDGGGMDEGFEIIIRW